MSQTVKEATSHDSKVASIIDEKKENRNRIHLWMAQTVKEATSHDSKVASII